MVNGIGTISDRIVDPFALKPEDINLWDIAWSLSQQNRYAGHTPFPWSVLSHTGLVFQLYVKERRGNVNVHEGIWLLFHDAAEAYIQDIMYPLKNRPEFQVFRDLEAKVMEVIWRRLGYDPSEINQDVIDRYDSQAAHIEGYKFFPARRNWSYGIRPKVYDTPEMYNKPLSLAKPQDFVNFVREQLIVGGRCRDINQLCEVPEALLPVLENIVHESATTIEGDVAREILERVPLESNPILGARV